MNNTHSRLPSGNPGHYSNEFPKSASSSGELHSADVKRILRNTYALLSMTLLFSAGVAVATLALQLPTPG